MMGDGGSYFLGYLLAIFILFATNSYQDYQLNNMQLSGLEAGVLKKILAGEEYNLEEEIPNKRERKEFSEKLELLGHN